MTSTASKKYFSLSTFIFGLAGILISFLILFWTVDAQTSSGLSGYAWSSNIGWIQTNPVFGGVTFANNVFSGYAWSSNIGWINFNPTGPYPENPQTGVRFNPTNKSISGWARALSYGGGWDGWIKMSGTASNGNTYGIVSNPTGLLSGYAWGDDVVGWVDFSRVTCNGCVGPVVPPQSFNLTVTKTGTGTGSVTTSPTGTNCVGVPSCNTYTAGTSVTLTAGPTLGSTFSWGGDCSDFGTSLSCYVTMNDNRDVTARFESTGGEDEDDDDSHVLSINIVGQGGVGVNGETCRPSAGNPDCQYTLLEGSKNLSATPDNGWVFTGWSGGGCTGSNPTCPVNLDGDKTVTATFTEEETEPTGDPFTVECGGEFVVVNGVQRCVILVQCEDSTVDCSSQNILSDDYIKILPASEEPVSYEFPIVGSIVPEWLSLITCGTSDLSSCTQEFRPGQIVVKTGDFFIRAKELLGSNSGNGFTYAKTLTIKIGDYSVPFILRFLPRSGTGQ